MPASVSLARDKGRAQPPATVLVVDDDELVREMAATFLSMRGYRVIEAGSGDEAMAMLDDGASHIDVVFTDLRMPGRLDGVGLARWVRAHCPETRVLITSGHTSGAQQVVEVSNGPLIPKPYQPDDVVRRVQALTGQAETH